MPLAIHPSFRTRTANNRRLHNHTNRSFCLWFAIDRDKSLSIIRGVSLSLARGKAKSPTPHTGETAQLHSHRRATEELQGTGRRQKQHQQVHFRGFTHCLYAVQKFQADAELGSGRF